MIAGGAGLAVIVAIVLISVFATRRPGPTPSPTPSTAPPRDLDSILLDPADLSNIMGVVSMQSTERSQAMRAPQGTLSNPGCLGALDPIEAPAYQNSGFTGVRGQALHTADVNDPHRVYQAAVDFPSAERAQVFVTTSADNWKACGGQTVTVTEGNQTVQWNFGPLNGAPPRIVQRHTQATAGGHVCQRVLSAVSDVLIDVQACAVNVTDEASRIADQMAARVTP